MKRYVYPVRVIAEQFDGTLIMANDYGLVPDLDQPDQYLEMWHDDECCDRDVTVKQGDWLVKADVPVNVGLPEYQVYSDEAFHRKFRLSTD